jgi:hypothetical protein
LVDLNNDSEINEDWEGKLEEDFPFISWLDSPEIISIKTRTASKSPIMYRSNALNPISHCLMGPLFISSINNEHNQVIGLQDEIDYYQQIKGDLIQDKNLFGKYIAISESKILDFDSDKFLLFRKIRKRYPHKKILIRKVENREPINRIMTQTLIHKW